MSPGGRSPRSDGPGQGGTAGLFDDAKAADAMRTIGEVSSALGIRQHVLRYWEEQFPMLRPVKRSGGRRYYRPADIEVVRTIDRLVNRDGYTLRGARAAIEAGTGAAAPASLAPSPSSAPSAAIAPEMMPALRAIRGALRDALGED